MNLDQSLCHIKALSTELSLQIYWRDMDAYGHVNNGVYLRWFEEVRVQMFAEVLPSDILHMLVKAEINYRAAMEYPGDAQIACSVISSGNTSLTLGFEITQQTANGKKTVCDGSGVVVLWDNNQQTKRSVSDFLIALPASRES